jgi:hypothetical protein
MNLRIGSAVGIVMGQSKRAATIEGFNGFKVSLLLDDGSHVPDIDLSRIVPADIDDSHDPTISTAMGFDLGLEKDDNARIMAFQRRDAHHVTVSGSLRVWVKTIAAVTSNLYVRFRFMTESKIFDESFPANALTDNWKYLVGATGWSVSSAQLVNTGGNLGHVIVPKYGANYWFSHGLQFTLVSGSNFQLAAAIEGGMMLLDFTGGTSAVLKYLPDGGAAATLETITTAVTIAATDVITMFSFEKIIQIRKNNNIIIQFTVPVPGTVSTAWGFGDAFAITLSDFHVMGKAQGTRWFLPMHYTIHPQGASVGKFDANEQNRIRLLDGGLDPSVLKQFKISYAYTPQPKTAIIVAWKILGSVANSRTVRYSTKISITQVAAVGYKVKKAVAASQVVNYNIKLAIKSSLSFIYKTFTPVKSSAVASYKLKKVVTPLLLPVIYSLKGSPSTAAVVSYAVRGLVGQNIIELASVRQAIAKALRENANTKQIAAGYLTEKSSVNGAVADTLSGLANVMNVVGKAIVEPANVRQLAGANLTEKAKAAQAIAKTLTEQGGVLALAAQSLLEFGNVSGITLKTLTDVASVLVVTAKSLTESANARQAIAKTNTEQANINNDLAKALIEIGNVLNTLAYSFTEKAPVNANVIAKVRVRYVIND